MKRTKVTSTTTLLALSISFATVLSGCGSATSNTNVSGADSGANANASAINTVANAAAGTSATNTLSNVSTSANAAAANSSASSPSMAQPGQEVQLTPNNWINIHMVNDRSGWGLVSSWNKGGYIIHTENGGKTWYDAAPSGLGTANPTGEDFVNATTAWFTVQLATKGDKVNTDTLKLYHTEDEGKTWQSVDVQTHLSVPVYLTYISVIDTETMYMDVIPQHGMNGMPGELMVSHDGGKTWSVVKSSSHPPYGGAMQFTGKQTGWLSTATCTTCNRKLYQSLDGGKRWTERQIPVPKPYTGDQVSVSLPQFSTQNPNGGILQVRFEPKDDSVEHRALYTTTDGGKSWTYTGNIPGQAGLVSFPSTKIGVAIPMTTNKTFPTLYETRDGGQSWKSLALPKVPFSTLLQNNIPAQLDFVSQNVGWIVWSPRRGGTANNQLWETTDGGKTWVKILA